MNINVKEKLIEMRAYDAWPAFNSLLSKRRYYHIAFNFVKNLLEEAESISQALFDERIETTRRGEWWEFGDEQISRFTKDCFGIKTDMFSLIQKNTWDFFHHSRTAFEMVLQIINIALLDKPVKATNGSIAQMVCVRLDSYPEFKEISQLLKDANLDERFKYLRDFDNQSKHAMIIPNVLYSDPINTWKSVVIRGFKGETTYPEEELMGRIDKTIKFADDFINRFVNLFFKQGIVNPKRNRVHDISYHGWKNRGENTLFCCVFFIEMSREEFLERAAGDVLEIRPIRVVKEFVMEDDSFCPDVIFIREKGTGLNDIYGWIHILDNQEQSFYKKYIVRDYQASDFTRYCANYSANKKMQSFNLMAIPGEEWEIQ